MRVLAFRRGLFQLGPGTNEDEYNVSVVIAARNEEKTMAHCLEAILNQSCPAERYEVIVVDDQSSDGTAGIVSSFQGDHSNLTLVTIRETEPGWTHKKYALARGIEQSRGEIIMTTDADCTMGTGWITDTLTYFQPEVGMVAGFSQIGSPQEERSLFEKLQAIDFLSLMSAAAGAIGCDHPLAASGQNLAYRRAAYDHVRGFEQIKDRPSGDDVLLLQLIRKETDWAVRFAITSGAFVSTRPMKTIGAFFNQRKRWASNSTFQASHNRPFFLFLSGVFALHLLLLVTLPLPLLGGSFSIVPWICLGLKLCADQVVLAKGASLFGRRDLVPLVPLWEICSIPFVVLIGLSGATGTFTWKGRAYGRQGRP